MDLVVISGNELKQIVTDAVTNAVNSIAPSPPPNDPNKRLTIKEVCAKYNISKPTLHSQMRKSLVFEKLGRKTLFRAETVEAYFRSKQK